MIRGPLTFISTSSDPRLSISGAFSIPTRCRARLPWDDPEPEAPKPERQKESSGGGRHALGSQSTS